MLFRYWLNGKMFTFYLDRATDNFITISCNDTKRDYHIRVNALNGYAIKVNRNSISAADGARGLFSFLADCVRENFMTVYVDRIIKQFCVLENFQEV